MWEAGSKVNDVLKIQVDGPMVDDHAIIFHGTDFKVPWGVLAYFPTV